MEYRERLEDIGELASAGSLADEIVLACSAAIANRATSGDVDTLQIARSIVEALASDMTPTVSWRLPMVSHMSAVDAATHQIGRAREARDADFRTGLPELISKLDLFLRSGDASGMEAVQGFFDGIANSLLESADSLIHPEGRAIPWMTTALGS